MTKYNVHIYREMRLLFPDIEADSPRVAAELASKMDTADADDITSCDGIDIAALVDVVGDDEYSQSETIDFEPQRMLNAYPKLLDFAARIARMTQDGEEVDGREFVMENDDAVNTLNELIDAARHLTAEAAGRAA